MKIKIRYQDLVSKGACKDGLKWFRGLKRTMGVPKDKSLVIEWDALSMVWALSNPECRAWVRWTIDKSLIPYWSLREVDLSSANLSGARIKQADIRGASLYGANLRGANLIGADLSGANLIGADLSGANLRDAKLRDAYLKASNLGGASLERADLSGANLIGANLEGAYLNCAYYPCWNVPAGWRRTETGHLIAA